MLAQKPQKQENVSLPDDLFAASNNFYFSAYDAPGWNENSTVLGQDLLSKFENINDATFKEGKVFFEAHSGSPSQTMNVRRYGEKGFGTSTRYQKFKVLESNVNSQEGKVFWLRTDSVNATNLIETNDGKTLSTNISLDFPNAFTHKFTADKTVKRKSGSSIEEFDNAFTFDVTGTADTGNYHWLQFVWREIYGTDGTDEEFLDKKLTTSGGSYYLTEDHTPEQRNLNPDTNGASEPWYAGAAQRTSKTAKIIDRPSSFHHVVKADAPAEWTDVHSKFHGITYLAHDDGVDLTLKHEYQFELDWFFGNQHKEDPTDLLPLDMSSVKPVTRLGSTKSTSKMDPEVKQSFQQHYSAYADRLNE